MREHGLHQLLPMKPSGGLSFRDLTVQPRPVPFAYDVAFDHIKLIVAFTLIPHFEGILAPQNLLSADSLKLIVESISEGVQCTPATLQKKIV